MKPHRLAFLLAALLPLSAWAEPAREGNGGAVTSNSGGPRRGGPQGGRGNWGEDDWAKAFKFFQENSPKRALAYEKLPDDQKRNIRFLIINRWRAMKWYPEGSDLWNNKAKQAQLEDDVFGLKQDLGGGGNSDALKAQIKVKVTELVDLRIQERALHIERLEKLVADERKKLEDDKAHKGDLVDKRFEQMLNGPEGNDPADGVPPGAGPNPGGGGGGGAGGGPGPVRPERKDK